MGNSAEFRRRIYSELARGLTVPTAELLDLLEEWWTSRRTVFRTRMQPWKAGRIHAISWDPPVLEFTIERHPALWERTQRWAYDFDTNRAELVREWGARKNPAYARAQMEKDARRIVKAVTGGGKHPAVTTRSGLIRIHLGRLKSTRSVAYVLPKRTAAGRQARLKERVSQLLEEQPEFQRLPDKETRGTLCYTRNKDAA